MNEMSAKYNAKYVAGEKEPVRYGTVADVLPGNTTLSTTEPLLGIAP